jgi:hypothetical protein
MKNKLLNWVIRRFLWTMLSRPVVRAVPWTATERNEFDLFCRTSCGIKLFEFLRQIVASKTFNAVYHPSPVSANAEARGAQDILALLHRLRVFPSEESAIGGLDDEEQTEPQGTSVDKSDRWRWMGGPGAIG